MPAFTFRMPAGIPGAVANASQATVEAQILDPTNYPASFGVPGTIDTTSRKFRKIMTGDAAASVYGLYVRPYPIQTNGTDPLGTSTPPTSGVCNVLKRGYISVQLNGATPAAKGSTVYVRVAVGTGSIIGGIEAAADSTNTVALTGNTYFTGPADANGNVEIAFNI